MIVLSQQDEFRLHVLLASEPKAIRIDESMLTVSALDAEGRDNTFTLQPTGRDETYIRAVKNILADHYGFPGGYPTELNRWSGMGQSRSISHERMLLLGEPEAVTAVATSDDVSDELAQLAWWCLPTSANARHLLAHEAVMRGRSGPVLVQHLIEYLPFETAAPQITASITRVLATGLISDDQMQIWWNKAQKKCAYMLGFLRALPNDLPDNGEASSDTETVRLSLMRLASSGNPVAAKLSQVLSPSGQRYIRGCRRALEKPEDQETVVALLDAIAHYFLPLRMQDMAAADWGSIQSHAERRLKTTCESGCERRVVLELLPAFTEHIRAMSTLAMLSYEVVRPILSNTTATGSLMRRKLADLTKAIDAELEVLSSADSAK